MNTDTKIFLKNKFKEFYSKNRIPAPDEIEKREFGIGTLKDKIKIRHRSFKSEKELWNFLRRDSPFYISYSAAYYEFPQNQPMEVKNWLGAELVFDLDIEMNFLESSKLQRVKNEAMNLIEFLVSDFGISKKDISVNFSGSKGYHIHVLNEELKKLGSDERREIVDYITGSGLSLNCFMKEIPVEGVVADRNGVYRRSSGILKGPSKESGGWAGRIYNIAENFINTDAKELQLMDGIGKKRAEQIVKEREKNIKALKRGMWQGFISFTPQMQQRLIEETAVKLTGDADKMVTIDTSRLIRIPETLHGGSGFIAKRVKDLESFDPLKDAIAFSEEKIRIELKEKVPEFDMKEQKFGPFSPGTLKLPEYVGVYLLLKGLGDVL